MFLNLLCGLFLGAIASPSVLAGSKADVLDRGKWTRLEARTVHDVSGFNSSATKLSRFGGWANGPQAEATGFFRTEQIDNRWWLIDPDGYRFLSAGVCSVHPKQKDLGKTAFRTTSSWSRKTHRLLTDHGYNTLGCWSEWEHFTGEQRMAYTRRWNFMATFGKKLGITRAGFGHTKYPNDCMPLFHPGFEAFCDQHAKQLAETKDDPWLLGHFSDNELPLRPNALDLYLELPKDDPGHQAAKAWWNDRRNATGKANRKKPTREDQAAFLTFLADRYYTIVGNAIKKHDPNHLYLGSRVHGKCINPATFKGSSAVDVVSVNYYHRWTPEPDRITAWAKASGRPVLISEWYATVLPDPEVDFQGAGFRVKDQRDAGLFYQNHTLGLLEHPDCVGWHWFKYSPDCGRPGMGIVDPNYRPRREMLLNMKQVNRRLYQLADHFQEK